MPGYSPSSGVTYATAGEVTTGTETAKAVNPDALAGSDYGKRLISVQVDPIGVSAATGNDQAYFYIPQEMGGWNLVGVAAVVETAGTTGTIDIQIRNATQAADMLSTVMTIDSGETSTGTAATPPVIDTANDDVATGDRIQVDVDAVQTTPSQGLTVFCSFQLP